jgi:trimethylamine--corrinoid protein Co-methyltransferase
MKEEGGSEARKSGPSAGAYNPDLIWPIVPKHRWRILTQAELRALRDATYEILQDIGVHFPLPRALEIFADCGAQVDFKSQIVRLDPDLVERALASAPRYFTLGGRDPDLDFNLQEGYAHFGPDGCMPFVRDIESGEKRHSTEADVVMSARLVDYFPHLSFYWTMVSAGDCGLAAPLHELHAAFSNCRKHVQSESVIGERTARYALEMARVIAGDDAALRGRPPLSAVVCCIDPLGQDTHALETALVFAEAGLPSVVMAMNTLMSTGPATPAGALAVGNAEVISAITLLQLAYPGAPVLHSVLLGAMEPRTGGYLFHSPLADGMFGAAIELGHHHGLPTLGSWGGTDAEAPGWQSAKESAAGLISALVGAEISAGLGGLAGASLFCPENLVLDCDLFESFRVLAGGVAVDDETLALEVTRKVGPRGNFLMEDHTLRHMRALPFSELVMDARHAGEGDPEGIVAGARVKAQWILDHHEPSPLASGAQRELDRILASADREIRGDEGG